MMKKLLNIIVLVLLFFSLFNCKTFSNNKKLKTDVPKVESSFEFKTANDFPESVGVVNDFAKVFSIEEIEKLSKIIHEFEKETTNQIAIASIKSIGNYTDFNKYAIDLSNYWGVGIKEKDNGLTIIFSKKLRLIRITTGYGTEKILIDKICKNVIDQIIVPEFKKGNYYIGIEKGLNELIAKWK